MGRKTDRNEQHVSIVLDAEKLSELKALAEQAEVPVSRLVRHRLRLSDKAPLQVPGKKVKTSVRLPVPLMDRIKSDASRIGIPPCELISLLLEQWNLEKLKTRLSKKGKLAEV